MSVNIKWEPGWEKKVLQAADAGVRDLTAKCERALNALRPQYEGKPVEQIKPAVQRAWRQATGDGRITDPHLSEFSEAIRTGRGIVIKYDGLQR